MNQVIITPQILQLIVPALRLPRAEELSDIIAERAPVYNMNTVNILQEFIATVAYESDYFTNKEENLNYTTAVQACKIFPSRFKTPNSPLPFLRHPQAFANYVYSLRNGNTQPNDGWNFRGGGYIQLTGRATWTAYAKFLKWTGTLESLADKVRTDEKQAMDAAFWFFADFKHLIPWCLKNNFHQVSLLTCGSLTGIKDRDILYARCVKYIK